MVRDSVERIAGDSSFPIVGRIGRDSAETTRSDRTAGPQEHPAAADGHCSVESLATRWSLWNRSRVAIGREWWSRYRIDCSSSMNCIDPVCSSQESQADRANLVWLFPEFASSILAVDDVAVPGLVVE